jgi:uncharacterized protein YjbI with pentapeptide repeats
MGFSYDARLFAIHFGVMTTGDAGSLEIGDMDRDKAIKLLRGGQEGIAEWNRNRPRGLDVPDLEWADLVGAYLADADLIFANLANANLSRATFTRANFANANLTNANLSEGRFYATDLNGANLTNANFTRAKLEWTNLNRVNVAGADFRDAIWHSSVFGDVDLSDAIGLNSLRHAGPSTVGIDTFFRSKGQIPETFLRGCGVPEYMILNQKTLIGSMKPIQFYSCFISYSAKDEEFAGRLHSKMRDHGLRVWFAPEDVKGGKMLHEQIDEAIRVYDKLLLVLSRRSMESEWVKTEIRKAQKAEREERRRKLFPIRLVSFKSVQGWKHFDSDSGTDLAVEVRKYFIPDFTNWKDHDSFEAAWARLLNDLMAEESASPHAPTPRASRRKKPH